MATAAGVSINETKYTDGNEVPDRRILVPCRDIIDLQLYDGTVHHVDVNYLAIELSIYLSRVITPLEICEQLNSQGWAVIKEKDDFFKHIRLPDDMAGVKKEDIDYDNSEIHHTSLDLGKEFADPSYKDVERIISMPAHGRDIVELDVIKQTVLSEMLRTTNYRAIYQFVDMSEIDKMRAILNMLLKENKSITDPEAIEGLGQFVERCLSEYIERNYRTYEIRDDSFTIDRYSNKRIRGYYEFGKKGDKEEDKLTDKEKILAKKLFISDKEQITPGFAFFLENGGWINHRRKQPKEWMPSEDEILGKTEKGMDYTYVISKERTFGWGNEYSITMKLNEDGTIRFFCELGSEEVPYEQLIEAFPNFNPTNLQKKIAILLSKGINIRDLPKALKISKHSIAAMIEAANNMGITYKEVSAVKEKEKNESNPEIEQTK